MTKAEDWHRFCQDQIERMGGAFPDFRFYKQGAVDELVSWLETKAKGDKQDAMVFVTELTEFENLPKLAEMNALWKRLFPTPSEARRECSRCDGTGYVQVDGPFGLSAAYPCTHQPETDADRRMGVRMSPALAARYAAEHREADQRELAMMQKRERGELKGFERVTQAEVDAILARIGL